MNSSTIDRQDSGDEIKIFTNDSRFSTTSRSAKRRTFPVSQTHDFTHKIIYVHQKLGFL